MTNNFEDGSASKLAKSPLKRKTINTLGSPYSPMKQRHSVSPHKTVTAAAETTASKEDKKKEGLSSPTSISMRDSFIIKNADHSFDAYYQSMRKRKAAGITAYGLEGAQNTQ